MNATLLKGLVALVPGCMLFSGAVLFFRKGRRARPPSYKWLAQDVSSWSSLPTRCSGDLNTALVITSICRALFLA
jgi:hypothetical protein